VGHEPTTFTDASTAPIDGSYDPFKDEGQLNNCFGGTHESHDARFPAVGLNAESRIVVVMSRMAHTENHQHRR
jgi:hypothetical protein